MLDIDAVLDDQRAYYRARAPEYDDWWNRAGRASEVMALDRMVA